MGQQDISFRSQEIRRDGSAESVEMTGWRKKSKDTIHLLVPPHFPHALFCVLLEFVVVNEVSQSWRLGTNVSYLGGIFIFSFCGKQEATSRSPQTPQPCADFITFRYKLLDMSAWMGLTCLFCRMPFCFDLQQIKILRLGHVFAFLVTPWHITYYADPHTHALLPSLQRKTHTWSTEHQLTLFSPAKTVSWSPRMGSSPLCNPDYAEDGWMELTYYTCVKLDLVELKRNTFCLC